MYLPPSWPVVFICFFKGLGWDFHGFPTKILVIVRWRIDPMYISPIGAQPAQPSRFTNHRALPLPLRKRWFGREEFRFCRSAGPFLWWGEGDPKNQNYWGLFSSNSPGPFFFFKFPMLLKQPTYIDTYIFVDSSYFFITNPFLLGGWCVFFLSSGGFCWVKGVNAGI